MQVSNARVISWSSAMLLWAKISSIKCTLSMKVRRSYCGP